MRRHATNPGWIAPFLIAAQASGQGSRPQSAPVPADLVEFAAQVAEVEALVARRELAAASAGARAAYKATRDLADGEQRLEVVDLWARIGLALCFIANRNHFREDARAACVILERAATARAQLVAPTERRTLRLWHGLATAHACLDQFQQSHDLLDRVLSQMDGFPADDLERAGVRFTLAQMKLRLHDPGAAVPLLEQALATQVARCEPGDGQPAWTLETLADAHAAAGNLKDAAACEQRALDDLMARGGPAGSPVQRAVQRARIRLASLRQGMADLRGYLELLVQAEAQLRAQVAAEDPLLLEAQVRLGGALLEVGRVDEAVPLLTTTAETASRCLPSGHTWLRGARNNLGLGLYLLGDLNGARRVLEAALQAADDDPEFDEPRINLALLHLTAADGHQALNLLEDLRTRMLRRPRAPSKELLWLVRSNLALVHLKLGEPAAAIPEIEAQLADLPTSEPHHPRRLQILNDLALARAAAGKPGAALETINAAVAGYRASAIRDERGLRRALSVLGEIELQLGLLEQADAHLTEVVALGERFLRPDDPQRMVARTDLLWLRMRRAQGDRARSLAESLARSERERMAAVPASPREIGEQMAAMARGAGPRDALLSLVFGCGTVPATPALAADALLYLETVRGAQIEVARRLHTRADAAHAPALVALRDRLAHASEEVTRIGQLPVSTPDRAAQLSQAVDARDRLYRELVALAVRLVDHASTKDLGARLSGSCAVTFVRYEHQQFDPEARKEPQTETRFAALVLHPDGQVDPVPLGPGRALEELASRARERFRSEALFSHTATGERDPWAPLKELRRRLLDPVRARIGEATVLQVSVDDTFALLPLAALPLDDQQPLGTQLELRMLPTLSDLDDAPAQVGAGTLVAFGGLDFAAPPPANAVASLDLLAAAPAQTRDGEFGRFDALAAAEQEARDVARRFEQSFPERPKPVVVVGGSGTKTALRTLAVSAGFLHLATHGYFAPEAIPCTALGATDPGQLRIDEARRPTGLSPMVLTGLALSGANQPPDALGRRAGIVTAEELMTLDLSRCELVVLSACDTSLGVRRAGVGFASLRNALLGAGARRVVTSLWRVPDATTRDLMHAFYENLWVRKLPPHAALWQAQKTIRDRKDSLVRDWAGWVLTGR